MNYFSRLGVAALFSGLDEQPFLEMNAGSYVEGYDSTLTALTSFTEPITDIKAPAKVGLMSEVRIQYSELSIRSYLLNHFSYRKEVSVPKFIKWTQEEMLPDLQLSKP